MTLRPPSPGRYAPPSPGRERPLSPGRQYNMDGMDGRTVSLSLPKMTAGQGGMTREGKAEILVLPDAPPDEEIQPEVQVILDVKAQCRAKRVKTAGGVMVRRKAPVRPSLPARALHIASPSRPPSALSRRLPCSAVSALPPSLQGHDAKKAAQNRRDYKKTVERITSHAQALRMRKQMDDNSRHARPAPRHRSSLCVERLRLLPAAVATAADRRRPPSSLAPAATLPRCHAAARAAPGPFEVSRSRGITARPPFGQWLLQRTPCPWAFDRPR